jgi:AcrR family transcriptional regulator
MRSKLAESAFELFSLQGFKSVNLDAIAAHAGVTKGSLYWHYDSKKEVILAACHYYYQHWQEEAESQIAAGSDPLDQLERVIRMSVQNCLFDPQNRVFTTEIFAMSLQDPEIRAGWAEFYDIVRELFIRLVRSAVDAGQTHVSDPRASVNWMLATIEGIKQRAAFEPEICTPSERESIVAGLLKIVCGGSPAAVAC